MSEKILTVSIAAYNVEAYIRQTLDSLMDERIIDDLEVFVIDDGGTDQTLEIAKEYAAKYPDSIIPVHKTNGGYGTTVNYSVSHATGKYFRLLDGDDWYDKDALYQLVAKLKEIDSDVVITPHFRVKSPDSMQLVSFKAETWGKEFPLRSLDDKQVDGFSMHSITYKTSILLQSNLHLPEHCLYTDGIFATVPMARCQTIYYLDADVYRYRIGRAGQSEERASKVKHRHEHEKVALIISERYEELKSQSINNSRQIRLTVTMICQGAVRSLLMSPVNKETYLELKAFDKRIKKASADIYKNESRVGKIGILLTVLRITGYMPYWLLKLIPGGFPYQM